MKAALRILLVLPLCWGGYAPAQEGGAPEPEDPFIAAEARFVRLVEKVRHSVVIVTCHLDEQEDGSRGELPRQRTTHCGVLFDDRGHVATFGTRVADASRIDVQLLDGRAYEARLVGSDPHTGISALELIDPPEDLHSIPLGDSDTLQVGATLVAIGNPYGFRHSVSTGIVSGLDRVIESSDHTLTGMIQSTVAINPGDAGGLVVNSRGECVGIIASTFGRAASAGDLPGLFDRMLEDRQLQRSFEEVFESILRLQQDPDVPVQDQMRRMAEMLRVLRQRAGQGSDPPTVPGVSDSALGAQNINFVMPVNTVRWVVEGLVREGRVTRGLLGVGVEVDPIEGREHILVNRLLEDGPASRGGMAIGDRIVAYHDREIDRLDVLSRLIAQTPPGKKVLIDIERNGEILRVAVVMGQKE